MTDQNVIVAATPGMRIDSHPFIGYGYSGEIVEVEDQDFGSHGSAVAATNKRRYQAQADQPGANSGRVRAGVRMSYYQTATHKLGNNYHHPQSECQDGKTRTLGPVFDGDGNKLSIDGWGPEFITVELRQRNMNAEHVMVQRLTWDDAQKVHALLGLRLQAITEQTNKTPEEVT